MIITTTLEVTEKSLSALFSYCFESLDLVLALCLCLIAENRIP